MTYPPQNPRGVIFSAPMIKALIAGRKTQTRRLASSPLRRVKPGDSLWVRECFAYVGSTDPGWLLFRADDYQEQCRAHGFDEPFPDESSIKWTPSIHMPRHASRMTLIVEAVRAMPIQDISEADALAEGSYLGRCQCAAMSAPSRSPIDAMFRQTWCHVHGTEFKKLWGDLHNKPGERWADNPDIIALTFSVARRNIDQPPAP